MKYKNKKSDLYVIWLALFHYYTTFTGFISYLFVATKKIKISNFDFLFLCCLFLLLIFQSFIKDTYAVLVDFRFYWGWIFFYFIFKRHFIDKGILTPVLVLLSVVTLIEALLINTVVSPWLLPNFPSLEAGLRSEFVPEGFYQRPYSFGASATVSSSLLVVLMSLCNVRGWRFLLSVAAVLSFASGTGVLALMVLLLIVYRSQARKLVVPAALILLAGYLFFSERMLSILDRFAQKCGPDYISLIIDYKWSQLVSSYSEIQPYTAIFGVPDGFRGGDFGMLAFVLSNGIFGVMLLLLMLLFRVNRANRFPLFLILLTTLHYPVMFFVPGQMIFGLLLSYNKRRSAGGRNGGVAMVGQYPSCR